MKKPLTQEEYDHIQQLILADLDHLDCALADRRDGTVDPIDIDEVEKMQRDTLAYRDAINLEWRIQEDTKMKYIHIIDNQRRNGIPGYVVIRTFKRRSAAVKFVERNGKAVWAVGSDQETLAPSDSYGATNATYWNSGAGWQVADMPKMPLHAK